MVMCVTEPEKFHDVIRPWRSKGARVQFRDEHRKNKVLEQAAEYTDAGKLQDTMELNQDEYVTHRQFRNKKLTDKSCEEEFKRLHRQKKGRFDQER